MASLGMGSVHRKTGERSDTIIGVMWAIGMAMGIIFLDLSPGYKADLMSYLFGSILAVPNSDLLIMLVLNIIILTLVSLYFKELQAISFDDTFAFVVNVPVDNPLPDAGLPDRVNCGNDHAYCRADYGDRLADHAAGYRGAVC